MAEIVDKETEGANLSFAVTTLLPLPLGSLSSTQWAWRSGMFLAKLAECRLTYIFPKWAIGSVSNILKETQVMLLIIISSPFLGDAFEGTRHQQCLSSKAPLSAGSVIVFSLFAAQRFLPQWLPLCESTLPAERKLAEAPSSQMILESFLNKWLFLGSSRGSP